MGWCTEIGFGALSPKWDVFIELLLSRISDPWKRKGGKIIRARDGGWLLGNSHSRTNPHMNSQKLRQYVQALYKFNPDKVSALRRGSRHKIPPLTKKLFAVNTCWEGKISFLQWSVTGNINHTARQTWCSGIVAQHTTGSMDFWCTFCFGFCIDLVWVFSYWFSSLPTFIFFPGFFFFFFWEREHMKLCD